jgi:SpoVK/Ycf46/Vps4 family AAA+-type ATPase
MCMTNIHISMYLWYTAVTNRFEDIDPAMVRRFESRIRYIYVIYDNTRISIYKSFLWPMIITYVYIHM